MKGTRTMKTNELLDTDSIDQDLLDAIATAVEAADLESPEQVADLCLTAAQEGRNWREQLAECAALDARKSN